MREDGVQPADVQAAIQAAWMVSPPFAAELAQRYGLYDKICLCCAWEPLVAVTPTKALVEAYRNLAYQLCLDCHYNESRKLVVQKLADEVGNPCGEIKL